jgi:hypothetical protein
MLIIATAAATTCIWDFRGGEVPDECKVSSGDAITLVQTVWLLVFASEPLP